jgi:haloalkane dehalogenase
MTQYCHKDKPENAKMNLTENFKEHKIPRAQGSLYARDYPGESPAFVLMHGFPDNLHIYDELIPFLAASGRRIVTFDFLGFGASEKPAGATHTFATQLEDLNAVVEHFGLDKFVPVVHDSSGPTGINYTLENPERVAYLCILNSGYDDSLDILWPEMVELFARKNLGALSMAIASSPAQFGWLLGWQKKQFSDPLPEGQKVKFESGIGELIAQNFIKQPSSGPAFVQLATHFFEELARNTRRLPQLKELSNPVRVIWGGLDPYITTAVGQDRASHFKNSTFKVLQGGHWIQSDLPAEVAQEMLA